MATERSKIAADTIGDLAAEKIALRRRVLDWQDFWVIEAEVRLRTRSLVVIRDLDNILSELRISALIMARAGVANSPALMAIFEKLTEEANRVTADALSELNGILAHHFAINAAAGAEGRSKGIWADQALAVGQGVLPLAAAGALLAMLPGFATTTTTVMFGLATVSAISVPLLVAGAGGVAALSAFGVINLKGLRGAEQRKLRLAIEAEMERRFCMPAGADAEISLLVQLERAFSDAAQQIMETR